MKVLIAYATYSSGTMSAADVVAETLKNMELEVTVQKVQDTSPDDFGSHDLVILASPSWWNENTDGMPHHLMIDLMNRSEGKTFDKTLFAVFGLGDTAYAHFCGAVTHIEDYVRDMKGQLIEPSLRIDGYYFEQDKNNEALKIWVHEIIKNLPPLGGRPSHL